MILDNPVMGKYLNGENFDIKFADENRQKLNQLFGGGGKLEAWYPDDEGVDEFKHPSLGKYTIEIYDKNIPQEELGGYIFRDVLHFLPELDKTWSDYRKLYKNSFSKEENQRLRLRYIKSGQYKKSTFNDWMEMQMIDGYIRGGFDEPSEYGDIYKNNDTIIYTPRQRKIIEKMKEYLNYGNN